MNMFGSGRMERHVNKKLDDEEAAKAAETAKAEQQKEQPQGETKPNQESAPDPTSTKVD